MKKLSKDRNTQLSIPFFIIIGIVVVFISLTSGNYVKNNFTLCDHSECIFDSTMGNVKTGYPSIQGIHYGTFTPNCNISVSNIYTYPSKGTGGHTEYVAIWGNGIIIEGEWNGYSSDWKNITFDDVYILKKDKLYRYIIVTGSYPEIHHTNSLETDQGVLTCTFFVTKNGKIYYDWIPAIKLWN